MCKIFSYHEQWRVLDAADGIELGSADSFAASEGAFLHGNAFEGFLIFSNYEGDDVVASQCGEDMDHSRAVLEAFNQLVHGLSTLHLKQHNG